MYKKRSRQSGWSSLQEKKKAKGEKTLCGIFNYVFGRCRGGRARLFSEVWCDTTKGNEHVQLCGKYFSDMWETLSPCGWSERIRDQSFVEPPPLETLKTQLGKDAAIWSVCTCSEEEVVAEASKSLGSFNPIYSTSLHCYNWLMAETTNWQMWPSLILQFYVIYVYQQ